jgi:hypothetical protein
MILPVVEMMPCPLQSFLLCHLTLTLHDDWDSLPPTIRNRAWERKRTYFDLMPFQVGMIIQLILHLPHNQTGMSV